MYGSHPLLMIDLSRMARSSGPLEAGLLPARSNAVSGNVFAVVAIVLWAIGFPAAEELLDVMDPITLITMRIAMACCVMVPIWWVVDGPAIFRAPWGWGLTMGGGTFGIGTFLLLVAQDLTDAVTVAIVAALTPLVAATIEVFFGRRRFNRTLVIGLLVALAGGVVSIGGNLTFEFGVGAVLVVVAGAFFMLGSHLAVDALPHLSPVGRATLPFVGGFVLLSIVWLIARPLGWAEGPGRALTGDEWGMLAVYAIGAMALSQMFFIGAIGKIGVTMASFHMNVAPLYVMLIMVALGAAWSWPQAIGGAVVVFGAIYVQSRD